MLLALLVMWWNINVKLLRPVLLAVVELSLLLAVLVQPKAQLTSFTAPAGSCTAGAMRDGINSAGHDVVTKVWQFGCEGSWAYVWADVAAGPHSIGVTNVMRWRADLAMWLSVDRVTVCRPEVLPAAIYRKGCFSN